MSLGDLTSLIGLLAAALALLNEHDRRIWLAPWRPRWAWGTLLGLVLLQAYFLTAETWTKLHLVIPALVRLNVRTVDLTNQQWAVLPFTGALVFAGLRTWRSNARLQETWRVLQDQWAARDFVYLTTRMPKYLRSEPFRQQLAQGGGQFLAQTELVTHWIQKRPSILVEIFESLGFSELAQPWIRAVMAALASERTAVLEDFFRDAVEDDLPARQSFQLFQVMGQHATLDLWARLMSDEDALPGTRTGWETRSWLGERTDDTLLETPCGRLTLSRLGLALASVLPTAGLVGRWNDVGGHLEGIILRLGGEFRITSPNPNAVTSWDDQNDRETHLAGHPRLRGQHAAIFCFEWILDYWARGYSNERTVEEKRQALQSLLVISSILLERPSPFLAAEKKYLANKWILGICGSELSPDVLREVATTASYLGQNRKMGIAHRLWLHHPEDFGHTLDPDYRARLDALRAGFPESMTI